MTLLPQKKIDRLLNAPILWLEDAMITNPLYNGPHPYRGPETDNPQNKGKIFIFLEASTVRFLLAKKYYLPRDLDFREIEDLICADILEGRLVLPQVRGRYRI
ncbi:hypothetical protein H0H93_005965 [Arthromyces matolae]|nr:hypothetical protein H0H93_005965 [Arthromyces matolae]